MGRNSHEREKERARERERERKREREGDPVGKLFFPPPPPPSSAQSQGRLAAPAAVQDVTARLLMPEAAGQVLHHSVSTRGARSSEAEKIGGWISELHHSQAVEKKEAVIHELMSPESQKGFKNEYFCFFPSKTLVTVENTGGTKLA